MADIKIAIPTVRKWVRIIIADGRSGNAKRRVEMVGRLNIPSTVYEGQVFVNWRFDELREAMRGVACDLQAEGCTIVFGLLTPDDALDNKSGKPVSLEDVEALFKKYSPELEVTLRV